MRKFTVMDERKWLHQNGAVCVEVYEGCLLDNEMYACKRGYAAAYERYVNPNQSEHEFHFAPYDDTAEVNALWDEFLERRADAESAWLTWGAA